jgi:hypothetical protein
MPRTVQSFAYLFFAAIAFKLDHLSRTPKPCG